jgi:hypothetical protein
MRQQKLCSTNRLHPIPFRSLQPGANYLLFLYHAREKFSTDNNRCTNTITIKDADCSADSGGKPAFPTCQLAEAQDGSRILWYGQGAGVMRADANTPFPDGNMLLWRVVPGKFG